MQISAGVGRRFRRITGASQQPTVSTVLPQQVELFHWVTACRTVSSPSRRQIDSLLRRCRPVQPVCQPGEAHQALSARPAVTSYVPECWAAAPMATNWLTSAAGGRSANCARVGNRRSRPFVKRATHRFTVPSAGPWAPRRRLRRAICRRRSSRGQPRSPSPRLTHGWATLRASPGT